MNSSRRKENTNLLASSLQQRLLCYMSWSQSCNACPLFPQSPTLRPGLEAHSGYTVNFQWFHVDSHSLPSLRAGPESFYQIFQLQLHCTLCHKQYNKPIVTWGPALRSSAKVTVQSEFQQCHLNRAITSSCWTSFNKFQILIKDLIILWKGKTYVFLDVTSIRIIKDSYH